MSPRASLSRFCLALALGYLGIALAAVSSHAEPLPQTPPGGTVRAMAADPFHSGRVFLGTTTGVIFQSADGGAHWSFFSRIAAHDDWVVSSLVPDPGLAGHWYAALWSWDAPDGGIFESRDGGSSWQPLLQGHAVRALALAASDRNTLVAATLDGVYRSQDAGRAWHLISPAHDRELVDIESVAIDPTNPAEIYVGTWHLPWKTVNGGHDWWQMREGVIDDSDVFSIAVDRAHPTTVYLSACSGIYRSDNHGNLFRKIQGIPYSARRTPALVQDPTDPNTIYAGTTQGLWVTHDGGATWIRITSPDLRINAVLLLPAGTLPGRILLGTDFAGVFASVDGGKSFQVANNGFSNRQVSSVAPSPEGRYVAVTGDQAWGGIFLAPVPDALASAAWRQVPSPLPGRDVYSLHWSSAGLLAATERGVYLWPAAAAPRPAAKLGPPALRPGWQLVRTAPRDHIYALTGSAPESKMVWAATQSGLYQTSDGGRTWTWMPAAPAPLYHLLSLPAGGPASGWLFAAGNGFVLRSLDQGRHFIPGRLTLDGASGNLARINQLAVAPLPGAPEVQDASFLVLAATTRGLYQSRNNGQDWTLSGHGLPAQDIRSLHVQSDGIYALAATVGRIYFSDDGGGRWRLITLSAPEEALARTAPGLLSYWNLAPVADPTLAAGAPR